MQTLTIRPGRVRKLLFAGVAALFVLALLAPALAQAQTPAPPGKPPSVTVKAGDAIAAGSDATNSASLVVAWGQASRGTHAAAKISYQVRYQAFSAATGTWLPDPLANVTVVERAEREMEITGLAAATSYWVEVRTVVVSGTDTTATAAVISESGWTRAMGKTRAVAPAVPGTLTPTTTRTSITVTWPYPTADGAKTTYEVQLRDDLSSPGSWRNADAIIKIGKPDGDDADSDADENPSATITASLSEDRKYVVRVRAVLAGEKSGWTSSDEISLAGNEVAGKPTMVMIERLAKAIRVTWEAPADNGGKAITAYGVQYREANMMWPADTDASTAGNMAHSGVHRQTVITGLDDKKDYEVRVRAYNGVGDDDTDSATGTGGWSKWSDAGSTVTPSQPHYHQHGNEACHVNDAAHRATVHTGTACVPVAPTPAAVRTVTRTVTRVVERSPAPAPAPAPATPAIIGDSGFATTYLAVDGQSIELRVHPQAGGPASHTFAIGSFLRDADLGQTYQIVAGGKRRWIAPNSPLVYQVPWAAVNSMYTFASNVVAAIPLDESSPQQGLLVRGMDGRIVSYDSGMWRHVPNIATFQALGYRWCDVNAADAQFFSRISLGMAHPATSQPEQANYPVCG